MLMTATSPVGQEKILGVVMTGTKVMKAHDQECIYPPRDFFSLSNAT